MSQIIEGVYKQVGQPDQYIPIQVDADGRVATNSSGGATGGLTNTELRATPLSVTATARVCLGTSRVTVTSTAAALQSLMAGGTFPVGTVVVELQADGGTVRIRRDNGVPTTTLGYRLDDGLTLTVDSAPTSVQVVASASTFLNVACFDRV
jgi:hypothetical protein